MRSRCEGFVSDFSEESGGGPEADSGHASQDRPKRGGVHQAFNFAGNFLALLAQGRELLGKTPLRTPTSSTPSIRAPKEEVCHAPDQVQVVLRRIRIILFPIQAMPYSIGLESPAAKTWVYIASLHERWPSSKNGLAYSELLLAIEGSPVRCH
ncbi:hypothetical protein LMG29542_07148 [Paraburkholderia humisilvae]|uniref:Uncharacterized protein n=1 Tax=Paraburkholderia humisilvae TaxID=627669 RepID=A0A6J5F366_9BURK|nr:hypothetical protein LMG29542_07148 [Paraburkholderia humisilvae]